MGIGSSQSSTTDEPEEEKNTNAVKNVHEPLSELYQACRENRIEDVERLLETATLNEINRIELHGSTALPATAFYGHAEIVQLLLEKGAVRTLRNNYGHTPYEEADTSNIKRLFERVTKTNRFYSFSASLEWVIIDPTADRSACKYKRNEAQWFDDVCLKGGQHFLADIKRYVNVNLMNIKGVNEIAFFIQQATKENSVESLLKAYTAETDFYNFINADLSSIPKVNFAKNDDEQSRDEYFRYWHDPGGYVGIIAHHPHLEKYSFTGTAYRGMNMSEEDITMYKVNTLLLNKAFLSASTERKVAENLATRHPLRQNTSRPIMKYPTLCTYKIRNQRTALFIEKISEYPHEKEVLITPRAAFRVISIRKHRWTYDEIIVKN
ncbi:unnamed protein product [Rotaria sp. Silwood2]|nr:unnamed protein product [Rotaria sp. Silwood2]